MLRLGGPFPWVGDDRPYHPAKGSNRFPARKQGQHTTWNRRTSRTIEDECAFRVHTKNDRVEPGEVGRSQQVPGETAWTRMALRQALRTWGTQRTRGLAALASSESDIKEKLLRHFPGNQIVEVQDTSGGCGTFYSIRVIADEFKGKSVIEQHKMINSILKVRAMRGGYGRSICQGDARIEWPAEEMLVRLKGMNAWTVNHRKDKICLESGLPANATIDCFKIRNVFAVKALQKQCIHASPL